MKPEDHIQFLYELLDLIGEMQSLIGEYCEKIIPEDEDNSELSPRCQQSETMF